MKKQQKTPPKIMDIHTHILPGVDDGAGNMEEALALLRLASDDGTQAILLTPHYRPPHKANPQILQVAANALREAARQENLKIRLLLGQEVRYQSEFPQKHKEGLFLPMAKSRYMLLEFSTIAFNNQILAGVRDCLACGYIPILAHAERYDALRCDSDLLEQVLRLGARIQLNADSVMGKTGFRVKRFCHRLLKAEKVHFIASDAHDLRLRPPTLSKCYARVSKKYGEKYARRLFWQNPRALADGKELSQVTDTDET